MCATGCKRWWRPTSRGWYVRLPEAALECHQWIQPTRGRTPSRRLRALSLLEAEPDATVVTESTVYDLVLDGPSIASVDARHARTGLESRYHAPIFIDCTGTAILGILAGAETMFGQESQAEYGESLAPAAGDDMHHGNTVFFRTRMVDEPVPFPDVPWALDVAKDYADLRGQLQKPGTENGPGPVVVPKNHVPDPTVRRRMTHPLTHFWEYGQWLDPYTEGERIRDHVDFPDAVVKNSGAFCLDYPGDEKYDFRLKHWVWDVRDEQPNDIPFRCLYSVNIPNLMMAGKHISTTHVAGSNSKFMGNGGQHGIATAAAAHLCSKHETTPRGIYHSYLEELRELVASFTPAAS